MASKFASPSATIAPSAAIPASTRFDSVIVPKFPALLAEFGRKSFSVLWRGGRDGFRPVQFHHRCDGDANTLTLIEDVDGNIFGEFTRVK
jgi:hypothetical protein